MLAQTTIRTQIRTIPLPPRPAKPEPARPAFDDAYALVYPELKRIARKALARGGRGTLATTALVHEAYAKLARHDDLGIESRKHFYTLCACTMRQIVVDHARRRLADKRRGEQSALPVTADAAIDIGEPESLLAISQAMERLQRHAPRLVELLEYRLFAGLELAQIAQLYGLTLRQVQRDWQRARLWLYQSLDTDSPPPACNA